MKIIDKKKDYYDYLTGKFGIDSNIIFDRRDFTVLRNCYEYVDTILEQRDNHLYRYPVYIKVGIGNKWYNFIIKSKNATIEANTDRINIPFIQKRKKGLPITEFKVGTSSGYGFSIKNVVFKDTFIPSFICPEEAYIAIYEYLSSMKDMDMTDSRTDKEKLLSAGFDPKTSFRNI